MEFDWEDFEEGEAYTTKQRIHVTLNKECKMFFNRRALDALGAPDGVSLMYDRRRSVIGVKATPLNRASVYKLRPKQRKYSGHVITAKNFCRRFSICPDETLAFTTAEVRDGILILDLNEVRSVKKG